MFSFSGNCKIYNENLQILSFVTSHILTRSTDQAIQNHNKPRVAPWSVTQHASVYMTYFPNMWPKNEHVDTCALLP